MQACAPLILLYPLRGLNLRRISPGMADMRAIVTTLVNDSGPLPEGHGSGLLCLVQHANLALAACYGRGLISPLFNQVANRSLVRPCSCTN